MTGIILKPFQENCLERLSTGKVLAADTGAGKSIMSLAWYLSKECASDEHSLKSGAKAWTLYHGSPDLYIITTPKKRDSEEWESDLSKFNLVKGRNSKEMGEVNIFIDSWNNIKKYTEIKNSVFIFDEQRAVGSGTWAKSFVKIAKQNHWIMLSATPGDTWSDWCPLMIAKGYYPNRTAFFNKHAVYNPYVKYREIIRWDNTDELEYYRSKMLVTCRMEKKTTRHFEEVIADCSNKYEVKRAYKERTNPKTGEPFKSASELCAYTRNIINTDPTRSAVGLKIIQMYDRIIIFYTLTDELEGIKWACNKAGRKMYFYNGEIHDQVPTGNNWAYIVQYTAGSEAWNCTTCNAMLFWDLTYSYKQFKQATGRIDRLNTPYSDLYYYAIRSYMPLDLAIRRALREKKDFNSRGFLKSVRAQYSKGERKE